MEYRKLGKSNIEISAIAFGAWAAGGWMWGGTDQSDAVKAIQRSFDRGVTTIDTAPAYGFGLSEKIVGEAVSSFRDKVQILTKFGLRWDTKEGEFYFTSHDNQGGSVNMHKFAGPKNVIKECEESLKRLKTDYIDLYQIHWADKTTPIEETYEAVSTLIRQGKVLAAGVCNYSAEQIKTAEKAAIIVSNQVPYSMVNRGIEKEIVPYILETGKSILAYSPLQRGLLTGKITETTTFAEGDHRPTTAFFKPDFIKKTNAFLKKIKPLADEKQATLGQLVIKWTIEQPGITCALVGARNAKQAEENAKAVSLKLNAEEIKFINKAIDEV
ncbi:MAG TPA: aldo/keto reductase [Cytophagales bacterium]|nr:aldo/keto reductase [Cytophagales bacterium]